MIHSGTFCSNSGSWIVPSLTDLTAVFSALARGPLASPTAHRLKVTAVTTRTETLVRPRPRAHPWRGTELNPHVLSHSEMPIVCGPAGNLRHS